MNKKALSERDICTKFITPALDQAGWDIKRQIREEWGFTDGRIITRGQQHTRGKRKRADYVLYYRAIQVAIIEAKDNNQPVGGGMQQAKEYAEILDIPFVYSSNGDAFLEYDRTRDSGTIEQELSLSDFPSPEALWERYKIWKGITPTEEAVIAEDNHHDDSGMSPRYYQQIAINRTVEAVAKGQNRILLVMATGTGKTYTAFQIIWRLWNSKKVKRVLFLADRNVLVNQAKNNDFRPFGQDIMTKVKNRTVDPAYQIYFALYQSLTGEDDRKNIFKEFSPDFFDLIVIDECHRGSAKAESAWREILTYFHSAIHLGLTATPKETKHVSNIHYFGEPLYTYSLKQGIQDGFLAPYRVVRIAMDVDEGYRPEKGKVDKYGHEVEDRIYNLKDYDRKLVIDERTQKVAHKISEYLKATDRYAKTIVFCVDTDHAERMRQALVNENSDLVSQHELYVVRITGDDEVGQHELYNFLSVEERIPVIATTSKLLTTGVDTKMVKLIVLDSNIESMTEFKQIIGRGTRLREEEGKVYFTIMDFRKVTNHFADPDFDGEPIQIYEPQPGEPPTPPDPGPGPDGEGPEPGPEPPPFPDEPTDDGPRKYYINDVPVSVTTERVQYYGADGKLITESLKDYTRDKIKEEYASLDEFLAEWNSSEKKQAVVDELREQGVFFEELAKDVGKELDPFDLIAHVAFDQPPLTRKERAEQVKKRNYFTKYGEETRKVLEALLDKYADSGIESLEDTKVLRLDPFKEMGTPMEIVKRFGSIEEFKNAIKELESYLYSITA